MTVPLVEGLADKLRATVFEGEIVGHAEADSEALTVAETVEERQSEGESEGEDDADGQAVTVPLEEWDADEKRVIVKGEETEGHAEADSDALGVGDEEGERELEGDTEGVDETEGHLVTVLLVVVEPLALRETAPVADTDGDEDDVTTPLFVGEVVDV